MRTDDKVFIAVQWFTWVVFAPLVSFLGYVQTVPIDSPGRFWFILLFGLLNVAIGSVRPAEEAWDPETGDYVSPVTGMRMSRQRVSLALTLQRGIGYGFICYAIGGYLNALWVTWELIGAAVGMATIVLGIIRLVKNTFSGPTSASSDGFPFSLFR
jgi:hypothetical protein